MEEPKNLCETCMHHHQRTLQYAPGVPSRIERGCDVHGVMREHEVVSECTDHKNPTLALKVDHIAESTTPVTRGVLPSSEEAVKGDEE